MIGTYDVIRNGTVVGSCRILQQGLYYCFDCRCHMTENGILRLWLQDGECALDLGVLIPEGEYFILRKKLPVKTVVTKAPRFHLRENAPKCDKFIPVYPEEPFTYLARIKDSYYAQRDGRSGIMLKERS